MSGARRSTHRVNQSNSELLHRGRRSAERFFVAHLEGTDDFVIDRLHLLDEPSLIERSAVPDDRHRLRHLERGRLSVALADR
jgi:hypothetical protein